ncbi:MAG: hypothetical protein JW973_14915 [Bacteroidales bacterium]|nr:hypothetical protein [Bacteroidales bacterium]
MDKARKASHPHKGNKSGPISSGKKAVFSVMLFLFPFLMLTLIELSLRAFKYGDSYDLFVDFKFYGKEYKRCNPEYGKKYFFHLAYTSPHNDIFLKKKPENGLRIFVIGSSTVWGFPYGSGIMFSRILHQRLQDGYPEKQVEVVNTAITAVNSYTLLDKTDEILREKPDAILIYAGHNEFYGALGAASKEGLGQIRWLKRLHLSLLELKTYQLLRNVLLGTPDRLVRKSEAQYAKTATLMERIVSNKNIAFKSRTYNRAHRHYYKNMNAILRKAHRHHVPVVFSELVSNIKDLEPFCSEKTAVYAPAGNVYEEALASEQKGLFEDARKRYYQAKDLDCLRFRASEDINQIIHELGDKYGICIVPMKKVFENNSPNGLIGNNLLTEHVHPNIDGYFLIADAFYNALIEHTIAEKPDSSNCKSPDYYRHNWGYTELDSIFADLRLRQLKGGWPFQPDTIVNSFIYNYQPTTIVDSLAYMSAKFEDFPLSIAHRKMAQHYLMDNETEKAFHEFQSLLRIDPLNIRDYIDAGDILLKEGKYDQALVVFLVSLKINREVYVLSKIGEIYAHKGEFIKAIPYLEEIRTLDPSFQKAKVLKSLCLAYKEIPDPIKANKIQAEINMLDESEKRSNQVILYSASNVKEYINQALKQLQSGQHAEALVTLQKANEIKETNVANRIIGEILLGRNDKTALGYLKKAYYEYSSEPNFLNTLCYAGIHFGDFKYAEKILVELKQLAPGHPNIIKYEKMISQRKEVN